MKWLMFKLISILGCFSLMVGIVLPWTVSNNLLPIWLDIVIISGLIMVWIAVIERLALWLINCKGLHDE